MVGRVGADGKDVQIGRHGAVPGVLNRQLGGHGLVEAGGRSRKHHRQVMVVAHGRWTCILYAHVGYGAANDRGKIPRY